MTRHTTLNLEQLSRRLGSENKVLNHDISAFINADCGSSFSLWLCESQAPSVGLLNTQPNTRPVSPFRKKLPSYNPLKYDLFCQSSSPGGFSRTPSQAELRAHCMTGHRSGRTAPALGDSPLLLARGHPFLGQLNSAWPTQSIGDP